MNERPLHSLETPKTVNPIKQLSLCLLVWQTLTADLAAEPLGTNFTYQGELLDSGAAAEGLYDLQFELFDRAVGGPFVASAVVVDDVLVQSGVFSVELDFGVGPFAGDQLWLEIGVRAGSSTGGFTGLLPRQKLTAAPYALHAEMVALDSISGPEIADDSISAADLGANSVGANEIIDSQVQRRVSASCDDGTLLAGIAQDGSPDCDPALDVVFGEGVESSGVVFQPEATFLEQNFVTSRAGRLLITVPGDFVLVCSPTASAARFIYLTVDGVPIRSSTTITRSTANRQQKLSGITDTVVAAGTHELSFAGECEGASTGTPIFSQYAPPAAVVVLPE